MPVSRPHKGRRLRRTLLPEAAQTAGGALIVPAGHGEVAIEVPGTGERVVARDDAFSDRLRVDHPSVQEAEALGEALVEAAAELDRGRLVVLAEEHVAAGLEEAGLVREATIPGFYRGEADCAVLAAAIDPVRAELANPIEVARVHALLGDGERPARHAAPPTERAEPGDAPAIAALLADTFDDYPTPVDDPAYVARQIADGTPFRVVRDADGLLACASADLVRDALAAELTDCATRPRARGRGLMQAILSDLMGDLREMGYATAFTLARARQPGINLAFERLGFELHGTMTRSCRIGEGIEDMNVWSRALHACGRERSGCAVPHGVAAPE